MRKKIGKEKFHWGLKGKGGGIFYGNHVLMFKKKDIEEISKKWKFWEICDLEIIWEFGNLDEREEKLFFCLNVSWWNFKPKINKLKKIIQWKGKKKKLCVLKAC